MNIALSGASVLGRDHALVRKNCQDSYLMGVEGDIAWGVVCDGCGEGRRSEMGAHLTAAFVSSQLSDLAPSVEVKSIPSTVRHNLHHFYRSLLCSIGTDTRGFAFDHLLCTVVGFVVRGRQGIIFYAGDGGFQLGDKRVSIDSDNRPKYPVYDAVNHTRYDDFVTQRFEVVPGLRIAVATDGFDTQDFEGVFGKTPTQLKRWMNVRQKQDRRFGDDAAIVTCEFTENV